MKKRIACVFGIIVLSLLSANLISAQEQRIRLVKGRKTVLKSAVRDTEEGKTYVFRARAGQHLTIKLIGRDAVFILSGGTAGSVENYSEETKFWSGKLPPSDDNEYYIRLSSYHKVASYKLEILVR